MLTPTDQLMEQLLEVHEAEELVGPAPLAYIARSGGAMTIIGGHTGWAWCWCQPYVEMVQTACPHGEHPRVTHRRTADMACPDQGGWDVDDEDGATYPGGQDPA